MSRSVRHMTPGGPDPRSRARDCADVAPSGIVEWLSGRQMIARTVAVAAGVLILAACGVHPSVGELREVPGASASYPGSTAVEGPGGIEGRHTLFATNPSVLLATYCTGHSATEVTRWFDQQLTSRHWVRDGLPTAIAGSDPADLFVWNRGSRIFRLEVKPPSYAGASARKTARPCLNAYEVRIQ